MHLKNAQRLHLPDIAHCHTSCFPSSLAIKLGRSYVFKTLEWFLCDENRFLFYVESEGEIVGYCGGFVPAKPGDGSSSGMLQHGFRAAIKGLIARPWLLFHAEVKPHYGFVWKNIKRKITGKSWPAKTGKSTKTAFTTYSGLVVIGVVPAKRGKGVAAMLMEEFERKSRELNQHQLILSVRRNNSPAIGAYTKFGWTVKEENQRIVVLQKLL